MNDFPVYPDCVPFSLGIKNKIEPLLLTLKDGISELSFYSLLIHSAKYDYKVTETDAGAVLLLRKKNNGKYFVPLNKFPEKSAYEKLKADGFSAVLVSFSVLAGLAESCPELAEKFVKDRDNADYVYSKTELVELKGKAFHKKKTHFNNFIKNYLPSVELLTEENVQHAKLVLEQWQETHQNIPTDYETAKAALNLVGKSPFWGIVAYAGAEPVGFALGEVLCDGKTFCTHFEKGLDEFNGIYQYLNQVLASKLDEKIEFINREQDLGDEGLRQSKLTYRPIKFIEKYCEAETAE
ncbi:MAG: phosphatidylglycerol lysyltransferase domain-containing protein [Treponemataceae bacterium]|nr:phosphatidylglycerol lysyltransferase domain-containing protein [Treponemataceae bacterium]